MKRPKGKLFALLAVFAALGIATASGAFTTVSAERTATVGVSGDASAALALDEDSDYASNTDGELQITFEDVNTNAITVVDDTFLITNNGNQDVTISISRDGANAGAVQFGVKAQSYLNADESDVTSSADDVAGTDDTELSLVNDSVRIGSGDTIAVGMYIDTSDSDVSDGLNYDENPVDADEEILSDITISAEADATADYLYDENGDGTTDVSNP